MRYVGKMKKMYSTILYYNKIKIIVENYIYKVENDFMIPAMKFATMTDIINYINQNINRIGEGSCVAEPRNEKFFE